ncbi:MAG: hypothetical protein LQ342_005064 [Letrouitia transgressa]|nr:MAG: hypothetical protein LQ342_005064 [Letrouitia transgressa]
MTRRTRNLFRKASCYGNFHLCIDSAINTINTLREINVEELKAEDRNCSICNQPFDEVQKHQEIQEYQKSLNKPVKLPCGHVFCKSCIFLWLRPLDNEASHGEFDTFESDEDAESETNPEDLQMTEREETRRSTNENEASHRAFDMFEPDEDTESETSPEDSQMTEREETQRSTNENASDNNTEEDGNSAENASDDGTEEDGTEEDGNSADDSNDYRLVDGWRGISRAAASPYINCRPADKREILSSVEEYRTSESRRYRSANNTCPLCRSELFPKPCHGGSSLVLMSVIRLFDAAYNHLDIDLNENEQRSRKNFVDYLGFDQVARKNSSPSPEGLVIIRVYALFEAMSYMRAFILYSSPKDYEPHELELLAELSDFIKSLEGKLRYFNLYRDPHFLLRDFQSSYSGPAPSERRNAIC